jgi:hypothetical protein
VAERVGLCNVAAASLVTLLSGSLEKGGECVWAAAFVDATAPCDISASSVLRA